MNPKLNCYKKNHLFITNIWNHWTRTTSWKEKVNSIPTVYIICLTPLWVCSVWGRIKKYYQCIQRLPNVKGDLEQDGQSYTSFDTRVARIWNQAHLNVSNLVRTNWNSITVMKSAIRRSLYIMLKSFAILYSSIKAYLA